MSWVANRQLLLLIEKLHLDPRGEELTEQYSLCPSSLAWDTCRIHTTSSSISSSFLPAHVSEHVLWSAWFQLVSLAGSHTAQFSPSCGSSPGAPASHQWWGDSYQAPGPAASHDHKYCCSDAESHHQWSIHSEISSKRERGKQLTHCSGQVTLTSNHQNSSTYFILVVEQLQIVQSWNPEEQPRNSSAPPKGCALYLTWLQHE